MATRIHMLRGTRLLKGSLSAVVAALVALMTYGAAVRAYAQNGNAPAPVPPSGPVTPGYVTPGRPAPGTPGSSLPKRVRPDVANAALVDNSLNASVAAAPRFTTVTVTPVEWQMGAGGTNNTPGKVEYKMIPLKKLFFSAWPMEYYRFIWPEWSTEANGNINAWYNVRATMPSDTTPEKMQLMLAGLLADRFKMSAHWETRDVDIYAVKIGPGGIKFQKSADPSNPAAVGSISPDGWHMLIRGPRQPANGPSGRTLAQFTQDGFAPGLLDRPLVDMTGLQGVYDIDLFVPRDPNTPWPMRPLNGPSTPAERAKNQGFSYAAFVHAVETQLGLTIEAETVPTKMLVIDNLDVVPTRN